MKKNIQYFSPQERALWIASAALIILSFIFFDRTNYLSLLASLLGTTSLIFNAKGNPIGQLLMVVFSILYGMISFQFSYYGEMITYLGMTAPMAVVALISWLRNPFQGKSSEVRVNKICTGELLLMLVLSGIVTLGFYFVLNAFHTANIVLSTISVTTSFIAVYLTFRRSELYALGYAANDVVLIALWILASLEDPSYVSVVVCFVAFLANDLYGYWSWKRMYLRQSSASVTA